jgi:hypothetical protein
MSLGAVDNQSTNAATQMRMRETQAAATTKVDATKKADLGTNPTDAANGPEAAGPEKAPKDVVEAARQWAKGVENAVKAALGVAPGGQPTPANGSNLPPIDHSRDEAHIRRPCPRNSTGRCRADATPPVRRGLQDTQLA